MTFSRPMRPGSFTFLKVLWGQVLWPVEPGSRWNLEPWVLRPPPKFHLLTTPWKPLPLLVALHVHEADALEGGDAELLADGDFLLEVAQLAQDPRRGDALGELARRRAW